MYYSSNHKTPLVSAKEAEAYLEKLQQEKSSKEVELQLAECLLMLRQEADRAPERCAVLGYN